MYKNIYAYTPPGSAPPFISINEDEEGIVSLTVRSLPRVEGEPQPIAQMNISEEELLKLAIAVLNWASIIDTSKAAS
jgi:hypothetical protein